MVTLRQTGRTKKSIYGGEKSEWSREEIVANKKTYIFFVGKEKTQEKNPRCYSPRGWGKAKRIQILICHSQTVGGEGWGEKNRNDRGEPARSGFGKVGKRTAMIRRGVLGEVNKESEDQVAG